MDVKQRNIVVYSALVLVLSIQFVIIIAVIFSFIPIKLNDFVHTLLPLYWDQVRPHRQLQFYAAYILFGVILQGWGMVFLKKQLQDNNFASRLWPMVLMNTVWVLIETTAAFKFFAFGEPAWAKWFLYLSLIAWLMNVIFWPEFQKTVVFVKSWTAQKTNTHLAGRWLDILLPIVVVLLLWPFDMTKLLAHIFAWDNFFHLDFFVMAPGWAYLHGLPIDMEVNSNYNVVLPAFLSTVAKIFGGFNYENVLRWIIIGTLAYFVAAWAFLRHWLKSSLLAAFGFLLAIKLQMFHWGILPVIWRYPSATPVRYLFDLVPVFFIYKHATTNKEKYLWLAAVTSGLMMAFIMEVGVYLVVAFYAYLFMLLTLPSTRKALAWPSDIRKIVLWAVLPFVSGFVLLWMVEGRWVWTATFWANTTEYGRLFLGGLGSLPMWDGLKDKQFFAFCMGFVIPAVYVLTIMIMGALMYLRQTGREAMFIIYVCVYGLGLYHYFVYRSAVTSYYVVSLPFVFTICFWTNEILKAVRQQWRRLILMLLVVLTFGALVTGYLFTVYPNALNLARVDFSQEENFYKREFNFTQDAALIDRLTGTDDRVPVVSSFETKILMEAQRKPFFYYFPMVYSEPMENLDFKGTEILTIDRMKKTLAQLDSEKPAYVFIEKKLISGQLPVAYYQHYQTLGLLVQYLGSHYVPADQGQWLVALKRK